MGHEKYGFTLKPSKIEAVLLNPVAKVTNADSVDELGPLQTVLQGLHI